MSDKYLPNLGFVLLLALGCSCTNNQCKTSNYIIEQAPFNSTIYNIEVARSINASDSAQVKFIFNSLEEIEGKTYLNMQVQTAEGCIKGAFFGNRRKRSKRTNGQQKTGKRSGIAWFYL